MVNEISEAMVLYGLECQLFAVEMQLSMIDQSATKDSAERVRQFVKRSLAQMQTVMNEARRSGGPESEPMRQWMDSMSRMSLSAMQMFSQFPQGGPLESHPYRQWLETYASMLREAILRGGAHQPAEAGAPHAPHTAA